MRDPVAATLDPASVLVSRDVAEPRMPGEGLLIRSDTSLLIGMALIAPGLLAAMFAPMMLPGDPFASAGAPFMRPSSVHPFGTDDLGRDVLVAVMYGARTSLIVGVAVA